MDLRIEAAVLGDVARGIDPAGNFTNVTDSEARDTAWKTFQHANRLLHYAAKHGVQIANPVGVSEHGPGRPHVERRRWNRPAPDGAA